MWPDTELEHPNNPLGFGANRRAHASAGACARMLTAAWDCRVNCRGHSRMASYGTWATFLRFTVSMWDTHRMFNPDFSALSCYLRQRETQYFVSGLLHPLE